MVAFDFPDDPVFRSSFRCGFAALRSPLSRRSYRRPCARKHSLMPPTERPMSVSSRADRRIFAAVTKVISAPRLHADLPVLASRH
jgi:hypothetical protein